MNEQHSARPTDQHKCFESADVQLGKRNTRLAFAFQIPNGEARLVIGTEKVNAKQRGNPLTIMANFCPFCGVHLP